MAQTKSGALKIAAKKAGMSVAEYTDCVSRGLKKCTACKRWLTIISFSNDKTRHDGKSSRCNVCSKTLWRMKSMNANNRIERREGDKTQARARINADVELGLRPNPNNLFCVLCGHKGQDLRHEYYHISGYSRNHHYDVLPFCSKCHHEEH